MCIYNSNILTLKITSNEHSEYEKNIMYQKYGLCSGCLQPNTFWGWCKSCNSKRFQMSFQWTSGNKIIDEIIRESQLTARNRNEVMEWIPYDRLRNIQYLSRGGFSTIYRAIWLDGRIRSYWNNEKNQLYRRVFKLNEEDYKNERNKDIKSPLQENEKTGFPVALKRLDNSSNVNDDFLNEWRIYLKFNHSAMNNNSDSIRLYGITQDPETLDYMIVMELMNYGSLRSNLMIKKFNPYDKFNNLYLIARSLSSLHKCNLVHGDFHSGNILLQSHKYAYISDFGLSRPADKSDINGIYGGTRPKVVEGTEIEYVELMKRCWDNDPNKRPTADDLIECFKEMRLKYYSSYDRVQVPDNELIIQNHPLSYYTSRRFDYSTRLNDLLTSGESLESCRIYAVRNK
ncbi:hypothetical protein RclHR1_06440007 [Rhizophagus clarus]|uniref:Kinase-like domain-containing protein n=1 Tax=Rhizophagus clarus TaxID=94130 RepID=A0A2Z6S8S2_9GLOM|nr:hypothetical protein RclHR1_06440007 [Rhizophagus clarus]GES81597.1 kinase-like domain-containing protein [Rhizophagus clarus]